MTATVQLRVFYYGCWQEPGHYLWLPGSGGQPKKAYDQGATERRLLGSYPHSSERVVGEIPWGYGLDSGVVSRAVRDGRVVDLRQGRAVVEHRDGWTALSFWDYSVDSRPGSSSTFVFDQILDGPTALAEARRAFSAVFDRFDFDIVLVAVARRKEPHGT